MKQDLERRLARLEAIEAIRALIGRYAEGADQRNDHAIMRSLFTDDAVWEAAGFGRYAGGDTIADELARIGREQIVWTMHYMVSPTVIPADDGRTARAGWLLWELAKVTDNSSAVADHWITGRYDAELRNDGDDWRFTRVTLTLSLLNPRDRDWQPLT